MHKCPKCGHSEAPKEFEPDLYLEGDEDTDSKATDDVLSELEELLGSGLLKKLKGKKPDAGSDFAEVDEDEDFA